jgi:hypothetical protein
MRKEAHAVRAGRLGGIARVHLYGNPGTPEGRRLGGIRSIKVHKLKNSGFKVLRNVRLPKKSGRLAELLGVLAGDGSLTNYQVSVVTNATTDYEHALFVKNLLTDLFAAPVSLTRRSGENVVVVLLSSRKVCLYLSKLGVPFGNKVKQQVAPPIWIKRSKSFRYAYLRGLLDTDGTVYKDKHQVKEKEYSSTCIAFTNASEPLLDFVETTWRELGYRPTRSGRNVRLRRMLDVHNYTKEQGFSNPKHTRKIEV